MTTFDYILLGVYIIGAIVVGRQVAFWAYRTSDYSSPVDRDPLVVMGGLFGGVFWPLVLVGAVGRYTVWPVTRWYFTVPEVRKKRRQVAAK